MSIVTDFLTGIVEFVADVFVFRHHRDKKGSASRHPADDVVAFAQFDFIRTIWIALVSVGLMMLLIFGFDVSVGWSVGIGMTVGAIWGYWKYSQLVREN